MQFSSELFDIPQMPTCPYLLTLLKVMGCPKHSGQHGNDCSLRLGFQHPPPETAGVRPTSGTSAASPTGAGSALCCTVLGHTMQPWLGLQLETVVLICLQLSQCFPPQTLGIKCYLVLQVSGLCSTWLPSRRHSGTTPMTEVLQ